MRFELARIELQPVRVVKRLSRVSILGEMGGRRLKLHLTNTGRLHEIVYEGSTVLAQLRSGMKTDGVVMAAPVGGGAALIDTRLQSTCFERACEAGMISWLTPYRIIGREYPVGGSRIDYFIGSPIGERGVVELKSAVFMGPSGAAMYPDTVSIRGRRHVTLLMELPKSLRRIIVFVAAHPGARFFRPCVEADPILGRLLKDAVRVGVEVRAVKMAIRDSVVFLEDDNLPIYL
ncbi:MAG: DNA/RNA nuclease SfsA [Nitrososphaerota archaeon]